MDLEKGIAASGVGYEFLVDSERYLSIDLAKEGGRGGG